MSTPQPEPRTERRFPVRTLGAVSASVLAFPLASAPSDAATYPYPKPTKALPTALDVAPGYQQGTRCLTESQPGAVAFAKLLNATYGSRSYGILRHCAAEHGEGRALDWMINATQRRAAGARERADPLAGRPRRPGAARARWPSASASTTSSGTARCGVPTIPRAGWAPYYGVSPHTDHIHFSFNWDGAYKRTSWWTGVAVTKPLTGPTTTVTPPPAPVDHGERLPPARAGCHRPRRGAGPEGHRRHRRRQVRPPHGDRARHLADEERSSPRRRSSTTRRGRRWWRSS